MHGGPRATLIVPSTTTTANARNLAHARQCPGRWSGRGILVVDSALYARRRREVVPGLCPPRLHTLSSSGGSRNCILASSRDAPQGHGQRAAPPASTRGGSHSTSLATHRDCGPRLALPPNLHLGKAGLYGPPRSLGTISNRLRAARLPQARENSIARTRVPFRTRRISISDPRCGNQSNQPAGADALRAKVNAAGSHPRIKRGSDAK